MFDYWMVFPLTSPVFVGYIMLNHVKSLRITIKSNEIPKLSDALPIAPNIRGISQPSLVPTTIPQALGSAALGFPTKQLTKPRPQGSSVRGEALKESSSRRMFRRKRGASTWGKLWRLPLLVRFFDDWAGISVVISGIWWMWKWVAA